MLAVAFKKCSLIITLQTTLAEAKSLLSGSLDTPNTLNCADPVPPPVKVLSSNVVFESPLVDASPATTAMSALLNTSVAAEAPVLFDLISNIW